MGNSRPGLGLVEFRRHQSVQAHDVARRIMQDEIDHIERDDARESLREIMKQFGDVAVRRNGLGDLQQKPQAVALTLHRLPPLGFRLMGQATRTIVQGLHLRKR